MVRLRNPHLAPPVFANLLQLITRRGPPAPLAESYDLAFVKEISVREKTLPNPRMSRLLLAGWVLIAGKCWLVNWLIEKYRVPIDPLWVIIPTLLFALLCTAVYFWRD